MSSILRTLLISAALAGCSNAPGSDGNTDGAAIDLAGADFATIDLAAMDTTKLCTTPACAKTPCVSGCTFGELIGTCSGALSVEVEAATVKACGKFCGLFDETPWGAEGLGCGVYHGEFPGCETCGFRWGAPSCVVVSPMVDYDHGGTICTDTCFDGRPPADMNPGCDNHDMFPQRWDLSM